MTWLLLGDANVEHLEANSDIWVNLDGMAGSKHRVQPTGLICAFGYLFMCFTHERHEGGLLVRRLSNVPKLFTLSSRLASKDDLILDFVDEGGIVRTKKVYTTRPWTVGALVTWLKSDLYRSEIKSLYEPVQLKLADGDVLSTRIKIWDPRWNAPKGNTAKVTKRVRTKRAQSPARTMSYYRQR